VRVVGDETRETKESLSKLQSKTGVTDGTVESLLGTVQDAFRRSEEEQEATSSAIFGPPSDKSLQELAALYNEIRRTQGASYDRTARMAKVVAEMRHSPDLRRFSWRGRLESDSGGVRLAAYAYLLEYPTCDAAEQLADGLGGREDQPFGQYRALKALQVVLSKCDHAQKRSIGRILHELERRFKGTDRGEELRKCLDLIEDPTAE